MKELSTDQAAALAALPIRTRNAIEKAIRYTQGLPEPIKVEKPSKPSKPPKPQKTSPADLFAACVAVMYNDGLVRAGRNDALPPKQVEEGVYIGYAPHGWGPVAADIASQLGGQGRPSPSRMSACWQLGRNVPGVIIDVKLYQSLLLAQGIVKSLVPSAPPKWSLGGCARQLFAYVGPAQEGGLLSVADSTWNNGRRYTAGGADRLLEGIEYGYHECKPGRYEYAEHYDVSGYYYNMLCRLKSLRLSVFNDGFAWDTMLPEEWERWQEVLAVVPSHKPLRNALAGAAAGATFGVDNAPIAYARVAGQAPVHKGDPYPVYQFSLPRKEGPFRPAGLLLVRTGYEKTLLECLTNAGRVVYSNIDSVICVPPRVPVWDGLGFTVKSEYQGETHIRGRGSWKCGSHTTLNYSDAEGSELGADGKITMPSVQYGNWL